MFAAPGVRPTTVAAMTCDVLAKSSNSAFSDPKCSSIRTTPFFLCCMRRSPAPALAYSSVCFDRSSDWCVRSLRDANSATEWICRIRKTSRTKPRIRLAVPVNPYHVLTDDYRDVPQCFQRWCTLARLATAAAAGANGSGGDDAGIVSDPPALALAPAGDRRYSCLGIAPNGF